MLKSGDLLQNRYRLQTRIREGAGRITWIAEDISVNPSVLVTLKLLAFLPQEPWENLKLFEREAKILQHLDHSNIPKYRDYFAVNDDSIWFALVHTYIPGFSLQALIDQGQTFSRTEIEKIAQNILKILIYLHELSPAVLHRDLKPSNIIVGHDQKVYLVDFGSVQAQASVEGATFTVVGTYGYTPLEQFGGRAVAASDLYALGATLIHLLTGTAPADLPQENLCIQFRHAVSFDGGLIDWIETLTHPDVKQRFQTARQALRRLEGINSEYKNDRICCYLDNRIRYVRESQRLKVQLPHRAISHSDLCLMLGVLVFYLSTGPFAISTFPFVILYWLISFVAVTFLAIPILGHVDLLFEQHRFKIEWKILGLCYWRVQGANSAIWHIHQVSSQISPPGGRPLNSICLRVGERKLFLGNVVAPMTDVECQQLIKELRVCLRL